MYSYSRHLIDRTSSAPCLTSFSEMRFLSLPSVVFQRVLTYSSTGGTFNPASEFESFSGWNWGRRIAALYDKYD
jgi:hypothetical protein